MTPTAPAEVDIDWSAELAEQLDFHWDHQLRPRLEGLTDDEYRWEPVPGCWSVRPRAESVTDLAAGSGAQVIDFAFPTPDPPPITTIAWRLGHLIVGVLGARNASHFDGPPMSYESYDHPATAAAALEALDAERAHWSAGVRGLDAEALAEPCGPAEGPFGHLPMAALVLHINREVLHHGAEICLLRDLHRASGGRSFAVPTSEGAR